MRQLIIHIALVVAVLIMNTAQAEQRIQLKSSRITGNSELPKILYVVPWKKVPQTTIDESLVVQSVSNDFIQPIDPEEFRQQAVHYNEIFNNNSTK